MKHTFTYEATLSSLQAFYEDNVAYWESQGKSFEEASLVAREEVAQAKHDPSIPNGSLLDVEAQTDFLLALNA